MKIRLSTSMLNEQVWYPIVDIVLQIIEGERHGLDPLQTRSFMDSAYVKSRGPSARDLVRTSTIKRSNQTGVDASTLYIDPNANKLVDYDPKLRTTTAKPLKALYLLALPFQIIVENEFNDGAFLLWTARALGRVNFIKAYRSEFISFRHAGGKHAIVTCASCFSTGVWSRQSDTYGRNYGMWGNYVSCKHTRAKVAI